MANGAAAPRASQAKLTSTGENPRSASMIHKNAIPDQCQQGDAGQG
jgi:hypothetical protein